MWLDQGSSGRSRSANSTLPCTNTAGSRGTWSSGRKGSPSLRRLTKKIPAARWRSIFRVRRTSIDSLMLGPKPLRLNGKAEREGVDLINGEIIHRGGHAIRSQHRVFDYRAGQ